MITLLASVFQKFVEKAGKAGRQLAILYNAQVVLCGKGPNAFLYDKPLPLFEKFAKSRLVMILTLDEFFIKHT